MSYSLNMDTLIVTVSWNHSQPNFIQRFEILLDGEVRAEALGSHITIEIQLPECKNYMLHIVAVDLCNNTSITEALPISCTPESTTSTTAEPRESRSSDYTHLFFKLPCPITCALARKLVKESCKY